MQSSTPTWHQDWVIDPDPLAAAQARHRPSGFGLNLKAIAMTMPPGDPPFVAAIYTDDSRSFIDQMFVTHGTLGCRHWMEKRKREAVELWRALGLDVAPSAALPDPPICEVQRWRDQWTVERNEGLGWMDLLHASGWAGRFIYTEVAEDGRMGWSATVAEEWADRVTTALTAMDEAKAARLLQETEILLMEEGYFHCSPKRLAKPFSDDWRTLWTVKEREGEQWLVHASGLAVTPVFGVVEDDGLKGWTLHVQPGDVCELDYEMRRRVGQKAWERVHDQGWQLCVEMGYVAPPGETVH